jgi:hypothetical protein
MNKEKYIWQKQSMAPSCERIECAAYDPIKDFRRDPTGYYVLIRPNLDDQSIEVAICNKDHKIEKIFKGHKAQDLYEGIFHYEKKHNVTLFSDKGHCAYLGKELKKAEAAFLSSENNYLQE